MTAPLQGVVLWITGLPSSGKTTLAKGLVEHFLSHEIPTLWLDSDDLRAVMTPNATYTPEERDIFYGSIGHIAMLAAKGNVTVVISATANRASYRADLRQKVPRFAEIWVDCSLEIRKQRDTKGLYRLAEEGKVSALPGMGATYQIPESAELTLNSEHETPAQLLLQTLAWLDNHFIEPA